MRSVLGRVATARPLNRIRNLLIALVVLLAAARASRAQPPRVIGCAPPPATVFYTVTPCRVFDTRLLGGPLGAGETRTFAISGICGVPADAVSVSVNITVAEATALGEMTAFPANESRPDTIAIAYPVTNARANNAVLKLGAGSLSFYNNSAGTAQLILDVNGYFK